MKILDNGKYGTKLGITINIANKHDKSVAS
jgi:hypothetical protein